LKSTVRLFGHAVPPAPSGASISSATLSNPPGDTRIAPSNAPALPPPKASALANSELKAPPPPTAPRAPVARRDRTDTRLARGGQPLEASARARDDRRAEMRFPPLRRRGDKNTSSSQVTSGPHELGTIGSSDAIASTSANSSDAALRPVSLREGVTTAKLPVRAPLSFPEVLSVGTAL
jgi:hypothetical protein